MLFNIDFSTVTDPENEGVVILRKTSTYFPVSTLLHPRRLKLSASVSALFLPYCFNTSQFSDSIHSVTYPLEKLSNNIHQTSLVTPNPHNPQNIKL
jgi:hypothetical protein